MTVASEPRIGSDDQEQFLRELLSSGLLIGSGVPGVYGNGSAFERVRMAIARVVGEMASADGAESLIFPPVIPRRELETSGYVSHFPHLAGSVFGFTGSDAEARIQSERAAAHEDWGEFQTQTDLMMLPAACYPVYPAIAARGPLPPGGLIIDIGPAWVFRHEPSLDPARRQTFRMHEIVRIGEPDVVAAWREEWAQRGIQLFRELGLASELVNANDPFFGREGRLLAANQSTQELKWELVVPIAGPEPTACASFNYHVDKFGETWGLTLSTGSAAHSACAAFGQERIVLALLRTHGLDLDAWPDSVWARLGG